MCLQIDDYLLCVEAHIDTCSIQSCKYHVEENFIVTNFNWLKCPLLGSEWEANFFYC